MSSRKLLITGGAGFIGSNLAYRLIRQGHEVTIFDNLSRSGGDANLAWLRKTFGQYQFRFVRGDIRDFAALCEASQRMEGIYHLAGQVAVTESVHNPRLDFEHNALGTFNVLEAARNEADDPFLIYSSTNKVYGGMERVRIEEDRTRYHYVDLPDGVPETEPLDFHSPYGCSKGAGDQYVRDYARIFGLKAVVARQSCIYGYRQLGVEDQGWVAWFIIAALIGRPITIYGNGKQVRDVLFVDDLLEAYDLIAENIDKTAGQIYNVGGGPGNTLSIWAEFGPLLQELLGRDIPVRYAEWRPGDQPIYVSDIRKIRGDLGWCPTVSVRDGVVRLIEWVGKRQELFSHL